MELVCVVRTLPFLRKGLLCLSKHHSEGEEREKEGKERRFIHHNIILMEANAVYSNTQAPRSGFVD